jgi:hypothetical protein
LKGLRGKKEMVTHTLPGRPNAEWREKLYGEYILDFKMAYCNSTAVPPEVMATAEKIMRYFPDAVLSVVYLYRDPLLKMEVYPDSGRSEREYIRYWDEDGFGI